VQRRKNDPSSPVVAIGIFLAIVTAVWEILTSPSHGERRKSWATAIAVFLAVVGALATAVAVTSEISRMIADSEKLHFQSNRSKSYMGRFSR